MELSTDNINSFIYKVQNFKKIRMIGSAALSLAYVASGRADVYYEKNIKLWDVMAGLAIIKAAGGSAEIGNRLNNNILEYVLASNIYLLEKLRLNNFLI